MNNFFKMIAVIKNIREKIEVDVIKAEYATGIYWVIISNATKLVDENGNKIKKSDLAIGDIIEITYNGQVMMSYPPQIVALCININNRSHI